MGTKVFAFIHLSKIKFPYSIIDSIYVKFEYGRKRIIQKTGLANLDSLKTATFNYNFSIPFSLKTDDQGRYNKHFLTIKIYSSKQHDDDVKIGRCKLDIANQINPSDISEREFTFPLNDNLNATIFYSLSIVRQKDYPNGMPVSFFSPAAITIAAADKKPSMNTNQTPLKNRPFSTAIPQDSLHTTTPQKVCRRSDQITSPSLNSPSSSEAYSTEMMAQSPLQCNYVMPDQSSPLKTSRFENDSDDFRKIDPILDSPEFQLRNIYLHLLEEHSSTLEFISYRQCLIEVTLLSYKLICHPENSNCDISNDLIRPFKEYHVFELKMMNAKSFGDLMKPVHKALMSTIGVSHDFNEFCSILATVVHFGLKLIYTAITETNCYIESMNLLENYVNRLILVISQSMIAILASSSFDLAHFQVDDQENEFGDSGYDALLGVQNDILLQLQNMRQNGIPTCLIEAIQSNCCASFDVMLYNSFVDNNEPITKQSVAQLVDRAKYIQNLYSATSKSPRCEFKHSNSVATLAKSLLEGISASSLGKPNALTRLIADRCDPPVVLPKSVKIDRLGPKPKDTSSLRIAPNSEKVFQFSFDWLIANDPGSFKK